MQGTVSNEDKGVASVDKNDFTWVAFYSEFAEKLLPYRKDRKTLIEKIQAVYTAIGMRLPKLEKDNHIVDLDPFTIFGLFNKGITDANRIAILRGIAQEFSVKAPVPTSFNGIPVLNNQKATFYGFIGDRRDHDIKNLWEVFASAMEYAKTNSESSKAALIKAYDVALRQKCIKWNLTMGLYWICPYEYINLDSCNRWYICNPEHMPSALIDSVDNFRTVPRGEKYLQLSDRCRKILEKGNYRYRNFLELSYAAWILSEKVNKEKRSVAAKGYQRSNVGEAEEMEEVEIYPDHTAEVYTAEDFLDEVYMSGADYQILINLLKNKKNIILQGAPGTGKTFAAKRLAYSMMGVEDDSRVMMVQFHQSYSYEDFIMGFRPSTAGFELKKGPFYSFCKKAEMDSENDYFFIVDEINRGNLSKIFGELFMLIENDKRGVSLQLLYSDETFSVPWNVYIIGTMNTADRSLAMLDYALRRRFAFFEFSPAFETEGFRTYRQEKNSKKFDNLIAAVEKLNVAIENDDTLGKGFRIGHSYFCTEKELDDMWLNAVITYEIVPLLNEYWFDEPSKVREWEHVLREAVR